MFGNSQKINATELHLEIKHYLCAKKWSLNINIGATIAGISYFRVPNQ